MSSRSWELIISESARAGFDGGGACVKEIMGGKQGNVFGYAVAQNKKPRVTTGLRTLGGLTFCVFATCSHAQSKKPERQERK